MSVRREPGMRPAKKGEGMKYRATRESGVALIVVMLLMLVFTVMLLGFYFVTTGEQKVGASDRDNTVAMYGAIGGIEKMSSDVAAFFVSHTSPSPTQIDALTGSTYVPSTTGITYPAGGYTISCQNAANPPVYVTPCSSVGASLNSNTGPILGNGPLAGLEGIITNFQLAVTADGPNNTEVKMTRTVQEVAVPVFQFGIFSDTDLSFFAGKNFGFGGRVHTNGNLFLAEDAPPNTTLTIDDKTTAYLDVIRGQLSNGFVINNGGAYSSVVDVLTANNGCPGANCRGLGINEGSVTGGPGSGVNGNWTNLSLTTYNGWILNGKTGAKKLNLALALAGGTPIAMIQRPPATCPGTCEDPLSTIGSARFYNQASLRILLSDQPTAITNLPGIDASVKPYPLAEFGSSQGGSTIQHTNATGDYYLPTPDACHPPLAESPGYAADNDHMLKLNSTLLGGNIKIEMQLQATPGTWKDVTQEILGLGVSRDALEMSAPTLAGQGGGTLSNNTNYYYFVTAVGNWGGITETGGTEATINTGGNTAVKLTWAAFAGATGYRVYRGASDDHETGYIAVAGGGTTSYTDNNAALTASGLPCGMNSVVHFEEAAPGVALTSTAAATAATNFIPINLYDPREGQVRLAANAGQTQGSVNGIMNLVEIDVRNLQKWFAGSIGTSGPQALSNSGYILYVSDRRMNSNGGAETGEFGNEDIINPSSATGAPNGALDAPEDVNGNGVLDTYGATPRPIGGTGNVAGGNWNATITAMPVTNPAFQYYPTATSELKNSVVIFRRALRLINGAAGNLPPLAAATAGACSGGTAGGFTAVSENPIYVQGDYNASVANGFVDAANQCHVPAAVIGDAVTLLSNNWTPGAQPGAPSGDANSFLYPTKVDCNNNKRCATTTFYRTAILGGKTISFPHPAWGGNDTGTDGGTHNFLRYIEDWSANNTSLNYYGSLASFYYSRQATGIYKYTGNNLVYAPPIRNYKFDTDFQNIGKLPPGTPRFTDVNALSYQQSILASQ